MNNVIQRCAIGEFAVALSNGDNCQVVDVREYSEYETERVAGARLVPLSTFDRQVGEIDRHRPVYLLCRSGKRAGMAAEKLHQLGYDDVRVVEGGMQAWTAAGHPVERGGSNVWSLERQVRFVAGSLVVIGALLAWLVHPAFIWLSAFIGAGLVFAAVTDTCGMAMMLARMPWNQRPKSQSQTCASS